MKDEIQLDSDVTVQADCNYKDTVFRTHFSDRANLMSLYNAVTGNSYDNPDELQIATLENAIYMGMKNDLAFMFDTGIYLYEHQSTLNPNIPLRDLFYISAEYSRLVEKRSLYSSAVQKIPAPCLWYSIMEQDRRLTGLNTGCRMLTSMRWRNRHWGLR